MYNFSLDFYIIMMYIIFSYLVQKQKSIAKGKDA